MRYSILIMFVTLFVIDASNAETWRGLEVAPENRCSPFDRKSQYPYPQSVEDEIVRSMGGRYTAPILEDTSRQIAKQISNILSVFLKGMIRAFVRLHQK